MTMSDSPRLSLVILAAGMGSRYGGLKQIEPVGPHGEIVLEYSLFDALRAGFKTAVMVIRKDIEDEFRSTVGHRIESRMEVRYVHQELSDLPGGMTPPPERTKPWGTAHAVYAARSVVDGPFAVINADDFYGHMAYRLMARHLQNPPETPEREDYAMVGYSLRHTLSDHGTVARGLCTTDRNGRLHEVKELTTIERDGDQAVWRDADGMRHPLSGDSVVSMNFWGFQPSLFGFLERELSAFLSDHSHDPKAECYLPFVVDKLIHTGEAIVRVAVTPDEWLGVTYREDATSVKEGIRQRIHDRLYPSPLWE
jgi:dTDP-glucose pyrophosphorylase